MLAQILGLVGQAWVGRKAAVTENLRPSRPEWASPITVGLGIPYSFASPVALGTRACPAARPPTGWKWIKPAAGPTGRARPAQEYCEPTMKEPTFGVKWKLAGSLGLLLALAIAILAWLLPTSLRDQLTHTLGAAADSHAQAVRVLLRQQDAQLRQWADWLPERQGAATALRDGDGDALQSILDHLGPEARAGLDLGSAQLLDREGRVLAHWTDGLGIRPSRRVGWNGCSRTGAPSAPWFAKMSAAKWARFRYGWTARCRRYWWRPCRSNPW